MDIPQPLVTLGIIVVCFLMAVKLAEEWVADARRRAEEDAQIDAFIAKHRRTTPQ